MLLRSIHMHNNHLALLIVRGFKQALSGRWCGGFRGNTSICFCGFVIREIWGIRRCRASSHIGSPKPWRSAFWLLVWSLFSFFYYSKCVISTTITSSWRFHVELSSEFPEVRALKRTVFQRSARRRLKWSQRIFHEICTDQSSSLHSRRNMYKDCFVVLLVFAVWCHVRWVEFDASTSVISRISLKRTFSSLALNQLDVRHR